MNTPADHTSPADLPAETSGSISHSPAPASQPGGRQPLILLVDDEVDVSLVARTRLEVNGFAVMTAEDGEQALARFHERRPDLVLLDLRMPRMDGCQVCQVLKSDPDSRSVPIIMFSASSSQTLGMERKCMELGADDYIRKPYSAEELMAKIRLHLPRPELNR